MSAGGMGPSMRCVCLAFLVAFATAVFCTGPQRASANTISGTIMTADNPDSVVAHAPVTLIFRTGESDMRRLEGQADHNGHFHFQDLAADTSVDYVLSIDYRGSQFLSAPIRFQPEQDLIEYNVLLSAGLDPGEVPAGHPPIQPERPKMGRPVQSDPAQTVLIVLAAAAAFSGLGLLARRKSTGLTRADLPAQARILIRDIASLDNSFREGIIGEAEYRKVREGLMERLRGVEKGAMRNSGAVGSRVPAGRA